jgi:hypothetical protein
MHSRHTRRIVLAVLGGLGAVGLVLAAFALLQPSGPQAGALAYLPVSWIVPLGSLFVIIGVTWLLLSQAPVEGGSAVAPFDSVTCPSCGRQVMVDWRLCPYCGAMMPEQITSPEAPAAPEKPRVANS